MRKWALGCLGGLGILVVMAIAIAILERAMSKGLAPIGAKIPIEVVQVNVKSDIDGGSESDPMLEQGLLLPQKGDRLDMTVKHHAKLASEEDTLNTPSLGFILARRNECLIAFPTQSPAQSPEQSSPPLQVKGYRTTTWPAYLAALYYDLRGGMLLLDPPEMENAKRLPDVPSHREVRDKSSQNTQITVQAMHYLLLDSRWCTQLKVHEGLAIASPASPSTE